MKRKDPIGRKMPRHLFHSFTFICPFLLLLLLLLLSFLFLLLFFLLLLLFRHFFFLSSASALADLFPSLSFSISILIFYQKIGKSPPPLPPSFYPLPLPTPPLSLSLSLSLSPFLFPSVTRKNKQESNVSIRISARPDDPRNDDGRTAGVCRLMRCHRRVPHRLPAFDGSIQRILLDHEDRAHVPEGPRGQSSAAT